VQTRQSRLQLRWILHINNLLVVLDYSPVLDSSVAQLHRRHLQKARRHLCLLVQYEPHTPSAVDTGRTVVVARRLAVVAAVAL
jgi:hypothetical protein